MTYNVFSGTLNPTQSSMQQQKSILLLRPQVSVMVTHGVSMVG